MKRVAFVLVGVSLVLTVALSANAARRHANATHVQQAEKCIRAALREENLAIEYIKEGKVSHVALRQPLSAALDDFTCAVNATRAAGALDEISVAESKAVRTDLHSAEIADNASAYAAPDSRNEIGELPLTFTPSGTGVFVAPSTFLFTGFGPYTENASITVNGTTNLQTGAFTLDASNDTTTAGCPIP